jgi:hypothetical protein
MGLFTVYQFIALPPPPLPHLLCASELLHSPLTAAAVDAHKNPCPQEPDGEEQNRQCVDQLGPSEFGQTDLTKARKEGLIAEGDQFVFPSTERIPKPPSVYRVMFLAFLLRSLSFPAHEFLRGLLFVYGMQLHQLTPNLILHIACFVTLCKSFLGIEPHWIL